MFPALRPILNKGGAGRYATREETVERLNPLVRQHHELLHAYDQVAASVDADASREAILGLLPVARTQSGKLSETVFSMGGTPPNSTDLEPLSPSTESDSELVNALLDTEQAFHDAVAEEVDAIHHQERTRAILKVVKDGSEQRLEALRGIR